MISRHRYGDAPTALLLLPLLLAAGIQPTHAEEVPRPSRQQTGRGDAGDASLTRPLTLIESAFRTEKPEPLTPLLPHEGKVYLALDSLGGGIGYFSRDQVYFILGGIFARHTTVGFNVKPQKSANNAAEKPRSDSGLTYCVGFWTFRRHDGSKSENQIFFVLSMRKGVWSLVEIREAQ